MGKGRTAVYEEGRTAVHEEGRTAVHEEGRTAVRPYEGGPARVSSVLMTTSRTRRSLKPATKAIAT